MHVVVTGGDGFIGRSLRLRLQEQGITDVTSLTRASSDAEWQASLARADLVFHLAGVNRPTTPDDYWPGNAGVTERVCSALRAAGRRGAIVFTSSSQAALDNPYGRSKLEAERIVSAYAAETGARHAIFRLPNVFGKWARPNYNSAIATFCHNLTRGLPISVHDPAAKLRLVYLDDVVNRFCSLVQDDRSGFLDVQPEYETTVGEVADLLQRFVSSRSTLELPRVGGGLTRALYATYVSYLPPDAFAYAIPHHVDSRGAFAEMIRTTDSGQVSFFTAVPGATRGQHYHHTKTEKFLVVRGQARFRFRHLETDERRAIDVTGDHPTIVESVPGWVHDITNIGDDEIVVVLWANETFDPARPDTVPTKIEQ